MSPENFVNSDTFSTKTNSSCYRTIFVILGVSGFAVSRSIIEKQRYDSMKVRERMRKSNEGEYEVPASRRYEV